MGGGGGGGGGPPGPADGGGAGGGAGGGPDGGALTSFGFVSLLVGFSSTFDASCDGFLCHELCVKINIYMILNGNGGNLKQTRKISFHLYFYLFIYFCSKWNF